MKLPRALSQSDDAEALALLQCYYGRGAHAHHHPFTGAWFDTWNSSGTRDQDADRFTADDLVAVTFLSVEISPLAARSLLVSDADDFTALLKELGQDRDLVQETDGWSDDWVGWRLWQKLVALPDVGPTKASKLYARKRPRLRPIYDSVVSTVLTTKDAWEPLRAELQQNADLHPRLLKLRGEADLPSEVSALRVFDVITWMEGTHGSTCPWPSTR